MYAACTGPPTVDHVTQVEVRVEVVLVWAPVVVGVNASQADATARLTSDRVELWPTKHPLTSRRATLVYKLGSGHRGMRIYYASVVGYGVECVVCPRHAALASAAALGGVAAGSPRGEKPTGQWPTFESAA